jgi:TrmH family RNA methyltransferase
MTTKTITSKDNAWFKQLRQLATDNTAYRAQKRVWIEGDHLCQAALDRGLVLIEIVLSDKVDELARQQWSQKAESTVVVPDKLMQLLSGLSSPSWIGAVFNLPSDSALSPLDATVVLDRLQDPGNVGSILRSAAAFGFKQVITTPLSAAMWSGKVVRAAMGAHFGLKLFEAIEREHLLSLKLPILLTSSHHGDYVHDLARQQLLPMPCMWVLGHEGQGVDPQWEQHAKFRVRIAQPGGEESLNVAAAAAICLHASASQPSAR